MSKEIPLTKGYTTLVDDEDYSWLSKHRWYSCHPGKNATALDGTPYIRPKTNLRLEDGQWIKESMTRMIMGLQRGDKRVVDHLNHNPLDNQKSNLRIVSHADNLRRHKKFSNNTSGYIGVSKVAGGWVARIKAQCNGATKYLYLGTYKSKEEAALAYNRVARESRGEHAVLNVIPEVPHGTLPEGK